MLPEFLLLFQETAQAPTSQNSLSGLWSVPEPRRELLLFFSSAGPVSLAELLFVLFFLLGDFQLQLLPVSFFSLLSFRNGQLFAPPSLASLTASEAFFVFLRLLQVRCLTSLPLLLVPGNLLLELLLVLVQV